MLSLLCEKNNNDNDNCDNQQHEERDDAFESSSTLHLFFFNFNSLLLDLIGISSKVNGGWNDLFIEQFDVVAELLNVVAHYVLDLIGFLLGKFDFVDNNNVVVLLEKLAELRLELLTDVPSWEHFKTLDDGVCKVNSVVARQACILVDCDQENVAVLVHYFDLLGSTA